MSVAKKAAFGFFWQGMSQSVQAIANIVFLMVMARLLSKESFGIFALASVIVSYISMFAEFGLGAALIQKKSIQKEDITFTFYANIIVSLILFSLLAAFSPLIVKFYDGKITIALILLLALQLILKSFSIVSRSLIIREMSFKKLFYAQTVGYICGSIGIGLSLAYFGFEYWSLVYAFLATSLITAILLYWQRPHSLQPNFNWKSGKSIINFGVKLTMVRLTNQTAHQLDKLVIGKQFSESILGIYERFQKVLMLPENYIGRVADSVVFSSLSRLQSDREKIQRMYISMIRLLSILMGGISIVCMMFPKEIILIILGEKWVAESHLFSTYAVLVFIQTFSRYGDTLVRATDRLKTSFVIKIVYLIIMIVGLYIGIGYGIVGAIYGVIAAKIVHSIMMLVLSANIIKRNFFRLTIDLLPILVSAIFFVGSAYLLKEISLPEFLKPALAFVLGGVLIIGVSVYSNLILQETDKQFVQTIASSYMNKIRRNK